MKRESDFTEVFAQLRAILHKHAAKYSVGQDTGDYYSLVAPVGPATIRVWGGKKKSSSMPIAWVQIGKAYVSYHLMGVYGNPKLLEGYSRKLRARMQGKSCFNFKSADEALFQELEELTIESLRAMKKGGYIS